MRNLLCVLFVLWAAVSLQAQTACPLGVCAHLQGGDEFSQMPQNLQRMHDAGLRWVRTDFSWSGIEPQQGTWNFKRHDKIVEEAKNNGIQVLGLLIDHGSWVSPAHQHLDDWLRYVEKTVSRYKDTVRHWEVWNETNIERFWKNPSGKDYTTLLAATYKKIKEIDRGITVCSAGTALLPMKYIEEMLQSGAGEYFDVFCIHPYRAGLSSLPLASRFETDIKQLQALLTKYNAGTKKIWITEMGFPTPPITREISKAIGSGIKGNADLWEKAAAIDSSALPKPIQGLLGAASILNTAVVHDIFATEEEQAIYAPQVMLLSLRFGIEKFFWYELTAPEGDKVDPEEHFGLLHRNLEPKPAYRSVAVLGKLLADGITMDFTTPWKQGRCCLVHWTQKDGTNVWAIWSPSGKEEVTLKMEGALKQAFDGVGEPIDESLLDGIGNEAKLTVLPGITYLIGHGTIRLR